MNRMYFSRVELYFKKCNYSIHKNSEYRINRGKKRRRKCTYLHCSKLTEALHEYIFIKLLVTIHTIWLCGRMLWQKDLIAWCIELWLVNNNLPCSFVIVGKEAEYWKFIYIINKSITDEGLWMAWHLCYATEFYRMDDKFFLKRMLILIRSAVLKVTSPCHRFFHLCWMIANSLVNTFLR